MKTLLTLLSLFCFTTLSLAQKQQPSASEILLGLKKLNTVGSVLYIAAHPDDENTRLLTWLSKEKNVRTGYLSITRGDGGQNLIGKEQGIPLGVIRTQELLGARRIDGAEQFFTRAYDFGFSKNPEETFLFWNKDSVLADMVSIIRSFQPDIIICRFPTTGEGGHGHHTASAILAVEAFDAAADPKRFPEQLIDKSTWKAKRILWNTFNFGTTNTTAPNQLQVDVGGFNPLLGKSYGEIAAESRSMHRSQGFGSAKTRGSQLEYFKHLNGDSATSDLFERIDLSWSRFKGASEIQKELNEIIASYSVINPEKSIPQLIKVHQLITSLKSDNSSLTLWKNVKEKELTELILQCAGVWCEASASDPTIVPGGPIDVTAQIIGRNKAEVRLEKISWFDSDTTTALELKQNQLFTFKHKKKIPASLRVSNPYWLNSEQLPGSFVITDRIMFGAPENNPSLTATFFIKVNGNPFQISRGLISKFVDPAKGEIYRPVEVLPPATVNFNEKAYVFAGKNKKVIQVSVRSSAGEVQGQLKIETPDGWKISEKNFSFDIKSKGEERTFDVTIEPSGTTEIGSVTAVLIVNEKTYDQSLTRIDYDHIPRQFILSKAQSKLVRVNLNRSGSTIGYIPGAGDDVPAALKQVGYTVTILTDELIVNSNLSSYDAIVTGVRAFNTNERLQIFHGKLMKYVEDGGNLIVQYNTNNRIGPLVAKISPFPFTISRDRVTDEHAEVRFTVPDHPSLIFPNPLSAEDFKGWIQERGIYFATETGEKYISPLSMNDPGEKPHGGSLIIAKHGKGNFVYTGIAFFRQLPAGVPGAYRLFANLLALPDNK